MNEKKVLIGCPVYFKYKYCVDQYIEAIKKLNYKNYDLLLVDNSKEEDFYKELKAKDVNVERIEYEEYVKDRIIKSREILRKKALEGNYDYFLSLEIDLFIQPDTIQKLLAHNKDIVSAYYANKRVLTLKNKKTGELKKALIQVPIVYLQRENNKVQRALPQEVLNKGLIEVGAIGLGCVLISRKVLEKIEFRYVKDTKPFDDMWFCQDVKKLEYKVYLDGNINIEHKHHDWVGIKK